MGTLWHFPVFILASILIFSGVMRFVLRHHADKPGWWTYIWVCGVVTVGGMIVAKAGPNMGLPVWFYYGVPAATTWFLPPTVFKMRRLETAQYLALALLTAPTIHVLFSLFLGWGEFCRLSLFRRYGNSQSWFVKSIVTNPKTQIPQPKSKSQATEAQRLRGNSWSLCL